MQWAVGLMLRIWHYVYSFHSRATDPFARYSLYILYLDVYMNFFRQLPFVMEQIAGEVKSFAIMTLLSVFVQSLSRSSQTADMPIYPSMAVILTNVTYKL